MRMLLTIFCLIFCLSNTAHALEDDQTCRNMNLKNETSCEAVPGCTWTEYQSATDTQAILHRCQGIAAQIIYECHHLNPNDDQSKKIYQQNYKFPYPNDYYLGGMEFSETFQIAFKTENDLIKKTETGDEGSYTPIEFTCSKPGYKLAGWAEETYKLLFRTQDYEISESDYSQYTKIEADRSIKWIWPPNDSNLSFSLSPVWVSATVSCDAGEYLSQAAENCAECPSGYYCPGVSNTTFNGEDQGITPCPAGSTSSTGAEKISDCFVEPFVTHFTFGNETSGYTTFSLPASGKAYYNRSE